MTCDSKNYYLGMSMKRHAYIILLSILLPDIIDLYYLESLAHNGYIYMEIRKENYSFPQAGCLTDDFLKKRPNT
jgi:hypothetical protein